jgi:HPt (histidine-containing phosphotransfer) domain-containing protein
MIQEPIYSTLPNSDLHEHVGLFVAELPLKVAVLEERLACEDREGACRAAHQLKGAAGSYGFGDVGLYAGRIEALCRDKTQPSEVLERAVDELIRCAERVRV